MIDVFLLAAAATTMSILSPSPIPSDELRKRLLESQERIWAWEIEYDDRGDVAEQFGGSYLHRVVAAKGPDRFLHWTAHGAPQTNWADDRNQQRIVVASDRFFSQRPLDRLYLTNAIKPSEPLPGTASNELLLVALGWWPLNQRPSAKIVDGMPASLRLVAKDSRYISGGVELVRGRWCHILECPGRDRLWLDVSRNCVTLRREIFYTQPAVIHRLDFSDFHESEGNFWCPATLRNVHVKRSLNGSNERVEHDAILHLRTFKLNHAVDDRHFRFVPLPGSIGEVDGRPPVQTVPGGEQYLDDVTEWVRRTIAPPRSITHRPFPSRDLYTSIIVSFVLTICCIGVIRQYRYPRFRR